MTEHFPPACTDNYAVGHNETDIHKKALKAKTASRAFRFLVKY